jgi:hypothetical protein
LPEVSGGRWGQGLTAEKMKTCVWLKPQAVVRIDFLEWTGADHLRHTKYVAMREDKDPRKVVRETCSLQAFRLLRNDMDNGPLSCGKHDGLLGRISQRVNWCEKLSTTIHNRSL